MNQRPHYYQATALPHPDHPPLQGSIRADVCVVGGGIAGCSTALHLAERGYTVALLEAEHVGWGASGRSGGQIIPGFASEQPTLEKLVGVANAKSMWDISVEGVRLLRERIAQHGIRCDWQTGQLQVAIKPRHRDSLAEWHQQLQTQYSYTSTRLLDADAVHALIATERYVGGLYDDAGGHLHPLNYTLGLAAAAAKAGVQIYEHSPAIDINFGAEPVVRTAQGEVRAKYVALCGNALLHDLAPKIHARIMPVGTYIIATESLGEAAARALIADNCGVTDTNFVLDYFRCSADHRLLFGGRVSYSGRDVLNTERATRKRMLNVFPQLRDVKIEFAWGGMLDITMNRAPDFGRIADNIYYLQGFSGHGVALTGIAGKLVAEAIAGQAERFDLFGKIKHRDFPGGRMLRMPALVLAMLWFRLRDIL